MKFDPLFIHKITKEYNFPYFENIINIPFRSRLEHRVIANNTHDTIAIHLFVLPHVMRIDWGLLCLIIFGFLSHICRQNK